VGIEVSTADPAAADLVVVSGLPNACYTFGHYSLTREGDTFRVEIVNLIPDDPMLACAEIYGMITTRIPLEGGVETCEFYEVVANGTPDTVQAIAPNVRCMGTPGQGPEDSVVLAFGQRTPIAGTDLELTLIEVPEDSRCPSDVVCVWAGRATVVLRVELDGRESLELSFSTDGGSTDGGSTDGGSPDGGSTGEGVAGRSASVDGYVIELLQLEPSPLSTRQIPMEEYAARVSVTGGRSCGDTTTVKCSG
jgi:hypothetical protein